MSENTVSRSGGPEVADIVGELSYFSLYDVAEQARWKMSDIEWDQIDMSAVDEQLVSMVKSVTFGELTTYSATHAFMNLFEDDIDFTQWLAVWLYEETKHPHVLAKWLSHVGHPLDASFFLEGRKITPMTGSKVEMLTFNIISEIMAASNYLRTAKIMPEPVLKSILQRLGKDEVRHSQGFEHYAKLLIRNAEDPDKERIACLRATWVFLHSDESVEHPVFLTNSSIDTIADEALVTKTRKRIRSQVTRRISDVVGIDMRDPDSVYDVYREVKGAYKRKRRAAKAEAEAEATKETSEKPESEAPEGDNPDLTSNASPAE